MNFIVQGPSPWLHLRYTRTILPIPTLATHTRAIHIWYAASLKAQRNIDTNRKILNYNLFKEYADPKEVQLGLWTKEEPGSRPGVSWLSLADVLQQHLGPGKILVPKSYVDENVKNERPGVAHYYIKNLKMTTYRKIKRHDRGTGSKEIRINHGASTSYRENLMSRAWHFASEHIPVEFHVGFSDGKKARKVARPGEKGFVETMNDPNELHLRPDVTLRTLPETAYMALPPSSDGRTEVCWVVRTLRPGETYRSKLKLIRHKTEFMEHKRLEVEIGAEAEMPPKEERSKVRGGWCSILKHSEAERGEIAPKGECSKVWFRWRSIRKHPQLEEETGAAAEAEAERGGMALKEEQTKGRERSRSLLKHLEEEIGAAVEPEPDAEPEPEPERGEIGAAVEPEPDAEPEPEPERGEIAPKEEQTKVRGRLKVTEGYQSFLRGRDAMYKRLDRQFPLICPIVRRLAPPHAPSEQLLKLAHLISYKLPHVRNLATKDPSVYEEICATMRLEETKDEVQARIQELLLKLGQGDKPAVEPLQRSSKVRPPNAPLTHPLLLGTKTFDPKERYCFRCGEVPCTREHSKYCNAPPDKWLSKWESDMLYGEVLRKRGPSPHGTDKKSDTKKTFVRSVEEATQSFQTRPANWRRKDGTIDIDAFRDSLQEESSSVESSEMDTSDYGPGPDFPLDGVVRRVGNVQPYQSPIKEKSQTYQQDYNPVHRFNLENSWPSEDVNGQDSPLGEESKKIQTVAPSKETIEEHTRRDSSAKEKQYESQAKPSTRGTNHITPAWAVKEPGIVRTHMVGELDTVPAADTAEPLMDPFAAKKAERLHREFHARARMLRREATELERKTQEQLAEAEKENERLKKKFEAMQVEAVQGPSERLKTLPSNVVRFISDPCFTKQELKMMEAPERLAALRRENGLFQRTLVRYHQSKDAIPGALAFTGLGDIKKAIRKPFKMFKKGAKGGRLEIKRGSREGRTKVKIGTEKGGSERPVWLQKWMKRIGVDEY